MSESEERELVSKSQFEVIVGDETKVFDSPDEAIDFGLDYPGITHVQGVAPSLHRSHRGPVSGEGTLHSPDGMRNYLVEVAKDFHSQDDLLVKVAGSGSDEKVYRQDVNAFVFGGASPSDEKLIVRKK